MRKAPEVWTLIPKSLNFDLKNLKKFPNLLTFDLSFAILSFEPKKSVKPVKQKPNFPVINFLCEMFNNLMS